MFSKTQFLSVCKTRLRKPGWFWDGAMPPDIMTSFVSLSPPFVLQVTKLGSPSLIFTCKAGKAFPWFCFLLEWKPKVEYEETKFGEWASKNISLLSLPGRMLVGSCGGCLRSHCGRGGRWWQRESSPFARRWTTNSGHLNTHWSNLDVSLRRWWPSWLKRKWRWTS